MLLISLCGTLLVASPVVSSTTSRVDDALEVLRPVEGGLAVGALIERAIASSPSVKRVETNRAKWGYARERALFAFLPRIDGALSYWRLSEVEQAPLDIEGQVFENPFPQVLDNYAFQASLSIPATEYFFSIIHHYDAVRMSEIASRHQVCAEHETVALRAIEALFARIRAKAAWLVSVRSLGLRRSHESEVERLLAAGLATRADLMSAAAGVAGAERDVERAKGAFVRATAVLARVLRLEVLEQVDPAADVFDAPITVPENFESAYAEALAHRPEVKTILALIAFHSELVSAHRGSQFPRLTLDANVNTADPNARYFPLVAGFQTTWQAGVHIRWSPNEFIMARSDLLDAEEEVIAQQADLVAIKDSIALELRETMTAHETAERSLSAAEKEVAAASLSFEDQKILFTAGNATTRDVLDAEDILRQAQLHLVDAYLELRLSKFQLMFGRGRLIARFLAQPICIPSAEPVP